MNEIDEELIERAMVSIGQETPENLLHFIELQEELVALSGAFERLADEMNADISGGGAMFGSLCKILMAQGWTPSEFSHLIDKVATIDRSGDAQQTSTRIRARIQPVHLVPDEGEQTK